MADRVRAHTRKTASGRTATVREHSRTGRLRKGIVSPRHAWKLLKKAFTANREKRHVVAGILGVLAVAELGCWLTLTGVSLALATAGVLALAVATLGAAAGGLHR